MSLIKRNLKSNIFFRTSYLFFIISLFARFSYAQSNSEVYLMEMSTVDSVFKIDKPINISNNEGYDNQPSFLGPDNLMYAGTRDGATDIAAYNIPSGQGYWINVATPGGEYSPQAVTEEQAIAAVRLDPDGLQRLYKYPIPEGPSELLVKDLKVAYFTFYDENTIACSVIVDDELQFGVYDLFKGKFKLLGKNAGRSIHKIPNSDKISYTLVNKDTIHEIYELNLKGLKSKRIGSLPKGVQDYTWLNPTEILFGIISKIYVQDIIKAGERREVADLSGYMIKNISRMSLSPDGKQLAFAAETDAPTSQEVVQIQLDAYNNRDLQGFLDTYSDNIQIYNFPNTLNYEGKETLSRLYKNLFDNTPDLHCEIKHRTILGNKVLDEEYITMNDTKFRAVAIYEVAHGKITKVTFVR